MLAVEDIVGGLDLTIITDLQDPVTITFEGQQVVLFPDTEMTVTAQTSIQGTAVSVDTYRWYLNGEFISDEGSVTLRGWDYPDGSLIASSTTGADRVVERDTGGIGRVTFRYAVELQFDRDTYRGLQTMHEVFAGDWNVYLEYGEPYEFDIPVGTIDVQINNLLQNYDHTYLDPLQDFSDSGNNGFHGGVSVRPGDFHNDGTISILAAARLLNDQIKYCYILDQPFTGGGLYEIELMDIVEPRNISLPTNSSSEICSAFAMLRSL